MNLTHSVRRHDQPLRLGAQHGYRLDGDQVFINADLNVPAYFSGGAWSLELWACERPHSEGPLAGVKVSEVALRVPTPIAHHVHHVETGVAARLPLHGQSRTMVLALVEHGPEGHRTVQDFSNYAEPQSFLAPHLEGGVGYALVGDSVVLEAEGVVSSRPLGNLSGTLSLELWAFAVGDDATSSDGKCLASGELPRLAGQHRLSAVEVSAAFTPPPAGRWQVALLLREWTEAHGYVTRDRRVFDALYEQGPARIERVVAAAVVEAAVVEATVVEAAVVEAAVLEATVLEAALLEAAVQEVPAVVAAAPVPAASASSVSVKAPEHLRLVTPVVEAPRPVKGLVTPAPANTRVEPASDKAEVSAASASTGSRRLISIQTASVEDLAKVKGLNLKLAKEIVKARPFASLNELVNVRGIGEKTLQRLKSLLTL